MTNGQSFGVLTFVTAESQRVYSHADLTLAEEIAHRAATAVENARLFTESKAAQEALARSNKELQRANEDLNQFAYSASHDLQEPLRMVAVFSQLLARKYQERLDGEADKYISYTVQGARRMEMLLKDLLAYTVAVNIAPRDIVPVNASRVLQTVFANLNTAIAESGAEVTSDGDLPELRIQEIHLVQLFQNLIGNAIKYRSECPPRVHIKCERQPHEWKISIKDNGIGIPSAYKEQVFGIFRRLHSSDKYTGTGIGLAICQRIVERYGGRIWVESEEGAGSTFCFTLPLTGSGEPNAADPRRAEHS